MKPKKPEHKRFGLIKHSLFTDNGSTMVKLKDAVNTHVFMEELWLKRLNATALDYCILFVATGIIWPAAHFAEFFLTMGILSLLYFTIAESYLGYTLGKKMFALNVVDSNGTKPSLKNSFTRNISKFNAVFLIADTIIGRFASSTHQKFLDKIANTTVNG
jgi:uncharacterized RDD family membrane protein YckC